MEGGGRGGVYEKIKEIAINLSSSEYHKLHLTKLSTKVVSHELIARRQKRRKTLIYGEIISAFRTKLFTKK